MMGEHKDCIDEEMGRLLERKAEEHVGNRKGYLNNWEMKKHNNTAQSKSS